ncbi:MAG TPA: T9SS type A sorting domain-containing protein [Flavobacterium sp.]|nr:T9SS type A sorting domain-containing protein [Flavobacterium sp.]
MKLTLLHSVLLLGITASAQNFTLKPDLTVTAMQYSSIDFADIDGDGDDDLFTCGADGGYELTSKLYKNDGDGNFTLADDNTFIKIREGDAEFGDVNGDGFPDLIISGNVPQPMTKLYINDGAGNFSLSTSAALSQSTYGAMAFADVDNDNDNDLVITGFTSSGQRLAELYINDGTGAFTLSDSNLNGLAGFGVSNSSVAFADVNGDDFQDLFITGSNNFNTPACALYINNGNGTFTIKSTPVLPIITGTATFGDIDNDGDPDLLMVGAGPTSSKIANVYVNDGMANFTVMPDTPFIGAQYGSSHFADVNNDGYLDILITGYRVPDPRADLYMNNGASGGFTMTAEPIFDGLTNASVAFDDVDNDGDQDLMATGLSATAVVAQLYLNNAILGLNSITANAVGFFPNPVEDVLRLNIPFGVSVLEADVYSLTGQLVLSKYFHENIGDDSIDLSSLHSGIYMVSLEMPSATQKYKIIKL